MFGEDWEVACPGCSSLADGLSGTVVHLNNRQPQRHSRGTRAEAKAGHDQRGQSTLLVGRSAFAGIVSYEPVGRLAPADS
jgi:predicted dithiol-disulfide oxidoreductase (DUF899 family)